MGCELEKTIGNEIHILEKLIHRKMDYSPARRQIESVTGTNAWIIGYIAGQRGRDVFQRDLERQFGITRSSVSKIVNLMEQKGMIERQSVAKDTRLKKLVLTDRALEIHKLMLEDFRDMENTLSAGFTEEELEQFFDYIHRMQNNLKNKEEEHR